jgi:hypothetical protein
MGSLDTAFQAFANWQTILFCLGIGIGTYVVRTVVEGVWKGASSNDFWTEGLVRIGPIGTGIALVFISKNFPWPAQIAGSRLGMTFYGAACGVASAYVYAGFRAWLHVAARNGFDAAKKLVTKKPVEVHPSERATEPPPAAPPVVVVAIPTPPPQPDEVH